MKTYKITIDYQRAPGNDADIERRYSYKRSRDAALMCAAFNMGLCRANNWLVVDVQVLKNGEPITLPAEIIDSWVDAGVIESKEDE